MGLPLMPGPAHRAPAVRYPFAPSRQVACALLALSVVGAAVDLAWWLQQPGGGVRAGAALLLWGACSVAAASWWHGAGHGMLAWDGGQWLLAQTASSEPLVLAPPRVCLDLQSVMLVLVRVPSGRSRWLWLERRADPPRWMDLRRALVAGARIPAAAASAATDTAQQAMR